MAHLPPKAPTMTAPNSSSWVDEFLDFSSTRRGSHRRSMSDSIAFMEAPMVEECRGSEFERFDDEQLMSMFNEDVVVSCSNASSPSDHNSINEMQVQPKSEPEEDESSCKSEGLNSLHATSLEDPGDKISDPKRIKRILANRQSAQRSRVRKLHYISELERSVTSLQAEVSVLSPRVAFLDHQRLLLNVDNTVLKQRIAALAQDKLFKDAHQEALKREIERLKHIYYQQNLKVENGDASDKEQLAVN